MPGDLKALILVGGKSISEFENPSTASTLDLIAPHRALNCSFEGFEGVQKVFPKLHAHDLVVVVQVSVPVFVL